MSFVFNFACMVKFTDSIFPWYFSSRIPFSFNKKKTVADSKFYMVLFRKVNKVLSYDKILFGTEKSYVWLFYRSLTLKMIQFCVSKILYIYS